MKVKVLEKLSWAKKALLFASSINIVPNHFFKNRFEVSLQ